MMNHFLQKNYFGNRIESDVKFLSNRTESELKKKKKKKNG